MKPALAAVILGLSLAGPVMAGPLEDAEAARSWGDYATALRLLGPLANQGDAIAQNNFGFMYFNGQGAPQNHDEAAKWFWLAANQGFASAQYNLGIMYSAGQGVSQDYVIAHMWFDLSAAQGDPLAAAHRDRMAARLTPAQIAEAQKLAREWRSKQSQ